MIIKFLFSLILSYIVILYNTNIFSDTLVIQSASYLICLFLIYTYISVLLFPKKDYSKVMKISFIFFIGYLFLYIIYFIFIDDIIAQYLKTQNTILETIIYNFILSILVFMLCYFIFNIEKIFLKIHNISSIINKIILFITKYLAIPVLLYIFVLPSFFQTFIRVTGDSMNQTLRDGDVPVLQTLGINQKIPFTNQYLTFGLEYIKRGDIVTIDVHNNKHKIKKGPKIDEYFIKRVIGLPGETIKIIKNKVYINNKLLDEPYTYFYKRAKKKVKKISALEQKYKDIWMKEQKKLKELKNSRLKKASKLNCTLYDCEEFTLKDNEYFLMGDNRWNSNDSRSFGPVPSFLIHSKLLYIVLSYDKDKLNYDRSFKSY